MNYLIPAFLAGFLTILAPCIFSLLPVILGGSVGGKNPWRPLVVTTSLGLSVIVFTLLLKATTLFIQVPTSFWGYFSGILVLAFGLTLVFPSTWTRLSIVLGLSKSEGLLHKSAQQSGVKGQILLGASLGPVFSSCSPTYAIIVAQVLPASFAVGFLNLIVYVMGMMLPLLAIGYGGHAVVKRFRFAANPNGWFKKALGILLVVVGLMILTGYDKRLEAFILESGYLGPIGIEQQLLGL